MNRIACAEFSDDLLRELAFSADLIRQSTGDGLIALDRLHRIVYWSTVMEQISGLSRTEVLGGDVFEVFPFLTAIGEDRQWRAALEGKVATSRDKEYSVPQSQRAGVFDAHYLPLRSSDGSIVGAVAVVRDVSERKRAEQRIGEIERRFHIMADAAPVLLWMANTSGLCTFFNQSWLDFTGRTQQDEWGVGWAEGVHFEDLQHCLDTYTDAFNTRQVFEMEYRLRRHDGEYRWVLDRGTPRYEPDGAFAGYIGSCIDITDRKASEAELRRTLRAREEFLGLVSHELRTPITALQLQLERLQRAGLSAMAASQQEIVGRIGANTERLAHLVESVLHVCRIESGKLQLQVVEFDLALLARATLDELRPAADRKRLELRLRAAPDLPPLHSDAELLRLVLTNLLMNAVKFTDRGHVELMLGATAGAHTLAVCDTGRGIAREHHARVFGVFEQLEDSRQKHTPGVGLGLALVKAMTSALGGNVSLESELGRGSVFTVSVPSSGPARSGLRAARPG